MDTLRGFGHLGFGSRLKRLSDYMMRETQLIYNHYQLDFDPYLFPVFKTISNKDGITNTELVEQLKFTQPAITQFVNKLLKKELVMQIPDGIDKRKKIIKLTSKGIQLLKVIQPIWLGIDKTINEVTQYQSGSFLEHINHLEDTFKKEHFSNLILKNTITTMSNTVTIIDYDPALKNAFYDLNIEWLEAFFYVEEYDKEVLGKPEKYILDKGGYIFFAKYQDHTVGTVALMPTKKPHEFELTKMAVSPEYRGLKIGQKLMQHCINFAKKHDSNLMLYSNKILENAIYIYRKYGFIEVPVEPNSPYERSDIKMVLKL